MAELINAADILQQYVGTMRALDPFPEPARPPVLYLVGSLRNPRVPELAEKLRRLGFEVFDDWYAAGPEADDYWQRYERDRGHDLVEALEGHAARHVFDYDHRHLDRSDLGVLLLPAGRSGHLELGYLAGRQVPTHIILEGEPERYDVMYRFATQVWRTEDDFLRGVAPSN